MAKLTGGAEGESKLGRIDRLINTVKEDPEVFERVKGVCRNLRGGVSVSRDQSLPTLGASKSLDMPGHPCW